MRRELDPEFKKDAVRLVLDSGKSVNSVARDLGISESTLRQWKNQLFEKAEEAFPGKGKLSARDNEIYKLRRELKEVKVEIDILKKAMAIFSKNHTIFPIDKTIHLVYI